ncbi:uncharacterized protein [Penaeus vannamei]|uniref:uncharacterized protein n=1 Tax=Penaeus vannamei TaxID=6689 RepID=UPI00387F7C03
MRMQLCSRTQYAQRTVDKPRCRRAIMKLHTDKIPVKKGVAQDDTISRKLFTACLEEIVKGKGIKIGDKYQNNLRFTDEIVLFSESANEMQQLKNGLNRGSLKDLKM